MSLLVESKMAINHVRSTPTPPPPAQARRRWLNRSRPVGCNSLVLVGAAEVGIGHAHGPHHRAAVGGSSFLMCSVRSVHPPAQESVLRPPPEPPPSTPPPWHPPWPRLFNPSFFSLLSSQHTGSNDFSSSAPIESYSSPLLAALPLVSLARTAGGVHRIEGRCSGAVSIAPDRLVYDSESSGAVFIDWSGLYIDQSSDWAFWTVSGCRLWVCIGCFNIGGLSGEHSIDLDRLVYVFESSVFVSIDWSCLGIYQCCNWAAWTVSVRRFGVGIGRFIAGGLSAALPIDFYRLAYVLESSVFVSIDWRGFCTDQCCNWAAWSVFDCRFGVVIGRFTARGLSGALSIDYDRLAYEFESSVFVSIDWRGFCTDQSCDWAAGSVFASRLGVVIGRFIAGGLSGALPSTLSASPTNSRVLSSPPSIGLDSASISAATGLLALFPTAD